jgi:hypothetical protein
MQTPDRSTSLSPETPPLTGAVHACNPAFCPECRQRSTGRPPHLPPHKIVNRILWNERGDTIDEIVISDCTVHVEMMSDQQWWIGITRADGGYWSGNFTTVSSRSRMRFTEQEREGFEWDRDDAHNERSDG